MDNSDNDKKFPKQKDPFVSWPHLAASVTQNSENLI